MRILILSQWFQPEPLFKGMPFAKALAALGHEVEVLTGFPNYPGGKLYPGYRVRLWQREMMEGIRVNRVALYPSHDRSALRRILNYLSLAISTLILGPWLVRRPDVIYVYNLVTLGPTAFLLRRLFGSKVIIDVQDLWPESVANSGMLKDSHLMYILETMCCKVYKAADRVTVLSPGFKEILFRRGVLPERIAVIYNWCDDSSLRLAPRDEGLARELGLSGKFNIVFAGNMGIVQGLKTVLACARLCMMDLPQVQFVFVGDGVDRPRLERLAGEMKLGNIRFLPWQPLESMGKIMALAEVLLVHLRDDPLFRITIPSKTQAYLAMGKPIIMAVHGDAAELIKESGGGIICTPDDPQALFKAVETLVSMDAHMRDAMGKAGADYYYTNLSLQAGVKHFEGIMRKLCASR